MSFEIGTPSEYRVSKKEAEFYLFCLGEGWRLPLSEEAFELIGTSLGQTLIRIWTVDEDEYMDEIYVKSQHLVPVRDLI